MTLTDPLKAALMCVDSGHTLCLNPDCPSGCSAILAVAVRSRDEEIARLRLKPDGNHDRCNAGLRSLLKTAEEEIAGLRKSVDELNALKDLDTDRIEKADREIRALRANLSHYESKCEEHGLLGRDCYSCFPAATKTGRKL